MSAWAALSLSLLSLGIGGLLGALLYRWITKRTLSRAREEADQVVLRAEAEAKAAASELQLASEKARSDARAKFEQETEEVRGELRESERRLSKREDKLHKLEDDVQARQDKLDERSDALDAREQDLVRRNSELDEFLEKQKAELLRISGMTEAEASEKLLARVEDDSRAEVAGLYRKIVEGAEADAREKVTEILANAAQRYSTEAVADKTVRSVPIPSDDLKGRIIGREGRNIRAIEAATGADIIVDDTPGVIVVSCFDKVRQSIAVESLQRLIEDGRMHPSRIEETVEKVRSETEAKIIELGKDAVHETKLRNVHPKVSEAMGKLHYRTSYGQNVLRHSIEVAYFSQIIADQLGLDGRIARRAGFLHDIGKAMDHEMEGGHPKIGMAFAQQHGEKEPVLNVIGGHHGDIPATTYYTPIVMAADALSSARPGARRESMERYVQRLTELQDIALSHDGVVEAHAIQAGREVRVMVDARHVNDDEAFLIASKIAKRVSDEMTFPGEVKVTVLRETRAVEIAR